jgi:hypothetical protein
VKHYVVCPGFITVDDERYYITGQQLQRLYKLDKAQCSVHRGFRKDDTPILDPVPPVNATLIFLSPQPSGIYPPQE